MAKQEVKTGQTDYSVFVYIPDSASTDGSGKTGLVAANLTVSYARMETDNDATITDATSSLNNLAALTSAHNDWGILEVSSTLAPGLYRLDLADAVFASGAWSAVVYVMVTTSAAAASPMEFVMVPDAPVTGVNVSLWNNLATVALPLVPTTAGRTLDVTATGGAGIDWANVENPTTALALTGTTIATTQKVDVETIKTNPVVNGGTITFPTTATLASTTNITAGTITTATNVTTVNGLAANVITAASINADAITDAKVAADVTIASVTGAVGSVTGNVGGSVAGSVGSVTAGVTLAASAVQAIWDALTTALTTVGSIGKLLADNVNATISSRLASAAYTAPLDAAGTRTAVGLASANLDTQLTAIDDFIDTEITAIKAKTDQLTFTVANSLDANIQHVNDTVVTGNGTAGTPWGP